MNRRVWQILLILLGTLTGLQACQSGPDLDLMLHESAQGAVYLERIPDRSFQAAHPIKLSQDTLTSILSGIHVRDDVRVLQSLLAGKPEASRVFSEGDVAYLAPLIADGLLRAAQDQQVGFRVVQTGTPGYAQAAGAGVGSSEPPLRLSPAETTSGSVYAFGRSLYVTLTQYRYRQEPPNTINMPNRRIPDTTGLLNRTVSFVPEAAKRPDSYRNSRSTDATLVIDYELLATLPLERGLPITTQQSTPSAPPVPPTKAEPSQKDMELEAIRKELRDIKQKLAEQEAERSLSRPQKPAAPRNTPAP